MARRAPKRRVQRLTGWLAVAACVSVALSIVMTPSWKSLLAGGLVIGTLVLVRRSLLKTRLG